jgi:hypothetical protein
MQWFEYDKAEEMLGALESHIEDLELDIAAYGDKLSKSSLLAIKNEINRLNMHHNDVSESMEEDPSS